MITVKGVEVWAEEINLEVNFQDLTEEGQKRIFLGNKDKFVIDALESEYSCIRLLVKKTRNECSSFALNRAIEYTLKRANEFVEEVILQYLSVPNLELEEENRERLASSEHYKFRLWMAKDEKTLLPILKRRMMFLSSARAFVKADNSEIFDAIVTNPNFELDEEIKQMIAIFSDENAEKIEKRIKELKKTA